MWATRRETDGMATAVNRIIIAALRTHGVKLLIAGTNELAPIAAHKEILAVVPDTRKVQAVKLCFEGSISPIKPSSILRTHPNATIYLDKNSASLLGPKLQNDLRDKAQVTVGR
jgi:6-phosphogluconolactonase/glucosamine-6-phosphate isomerase/deaminase